MSETPLYIDVGNSALKVVRKHAQGYWESLGRFTHNQGEELRKVLVNADSRYWVMGSVRNEWKQELHSLAKELEAILFAAQVNNFPSESLDYITPETLGVDRILACWGAWTQVRGDVIVLDAGTACTVDYMDEQGVYQGGVIAPGLPILEAGFKKQTPELPRITDRSLPKNWPGKSTDESMRWGILGSYRELLMGHIRQYQQMLNTDAALYITGGDAAIVNELLAGKWKAKIDEFLVFKGLEYAYDQSWCIQN